MSQFVNSTIDRELPRRCRSSSHPFIPKTVRYDALLACVGEEDMPALGARIRNHEARGRMGEVVIVAVSDEAYQQARLFETLVVADRP